MSADVRPVCRACLLVLLQAGLYRIEHLTLTASSPRPSMASHSAGMEDAGDDDGALVAPSGISHPSGLMATCPASHVYSSHQAHSTLLICSLCICCRRQAPPGLLGQAWSSPLLACQGA